jgi:hypothetical protein
VIIERRGGYDPGIPDAARPRRLSRRRLLLVLGVVLLGLIGFATWRSVQAGLDARAGRADLQQAADALRAQHVAAAERDFVAAGEHFRAAHDALHGMGPLLPVAHVIPLVRIQVRGLETMSDVGSLLSGAGVHLATASQRILDAQHAHRPLSQSLGQLRAVEQATHQAVLALAAARTRTSALDGYRLLGPLGSTRTKLETELASTEPRAATADAGMRLLLWVIGADGPRRMLVFSQNPDEVRPTGGFLGTYGLMTGNAGHVRLDRYGDINHWVAAHPHVEVPASRSPNAFQFSTPPEPQGLANVNTTPDWPTDADLAMRLWRQAGEPPVDGVVSLEPQTLARIIGVLGPVHMPSYGDTITAQNLVARLNFHTHRQAVQGDPNRKQFIVDLSHVVVQRLLSAPSSKWLDLGKAMAASFDAGEAMLWTDDPSTQSLLTSLGWAGKFPNVPGDFYADAEFEYAAKNGHGLQRTFDHVVTLNANGSGVASTTMVLHNTLPAEPGYNDGSLSYLTPYGPQFSTLDPSSDKPDASQPSLAGHPSAGYLRGAQPLRSMTLHVAFRCRLLARPRTDGSLLYTLDFRAQPGHTGDILHLTVHLPQGYRWQGAAPPSTVRLDGDYRGSWVISHV